MNFVEIPRTSKWTVKRWWPAALLTAAMMLLFTSGLQANEVAMKLLKGMADYVSAQKTISATIDTDVEVITSDLQKIQFTSSGQVLLSRPDKLRASRIGGYADVELVFDGKAVTLYGKHLNTFAQMELAGSVDQMLERLRGEFGIEAPGADFLLTHVYEALSEDILVAQHIGRGVIDGVECEHLAFRNTDTDWQIWIEMGARPIPRKYIITNKSVNGSPQYTLRIKDWKSDTPAASAFTFSAPAGLKKLDMKDLSGMDEVPPGVAK